MLLHPNPVALHQHPTLLHPNPMAISGNWKCCQTLEQMEELVNPVMSRSVSFGVPELWRKAEGATGYKE
jgi:hypothetical protein